MQDEWWYSRGSEKFGPLPPEKIRALLSMGAVDGSTLVWRSGRETWVPLQDEQELVASPTIRPLPESMPPLPLVPPLGALPKSDTERAWAETADSARREEVLALPLAGPWRRFWARMLDFYFYLLVVGVPLVAVASYYMPGFGAALGTPGSGQLWGFLFVPFALLVEAIIFGWTGSTFGKWLLGLKVITLGGGRPSFSQYLHRQLGVWWGGLGLGIPLVTLFTMNHQHSRVKAGNNASYDAGRFNVKARPIGWSRKAFAALATVAIAAGMVALIGFGDEQERIARTPVSWTNPATGIKVTLPPGWTPTTVKKSSETNTDIFLFINRKTRVEALLSSEVVPPQYSLEQYLVEWSDNVRDKMEIKPVGTQMIAKGHRVLETQGVLKNEKPLGIYATVLRKNESVWRLMFFGNDGAEQSADTRAMREVLFGTL